MDNNLLKASFIIIFIASLGSVIYYLYKIENIKREELKEYKNMVVLLEKYKPSTVSTVLKTDDNFMKVLISRLSSDKDFVAKVATEIKNK